MQGFLFLSTPFLIFLQDLKLFITNSFLKFLPALASIPLHSLCFLPLFLYTHCLLPLILFSDHCKHVSLFILQPILDYLLLTIFFSWFWEKIPWLQQSLQVNDFKSYISITIFFSSLHCCTLRFPLDDGKDFYYPCTNMFKTEFVEFPSTSSSELPLRTSLFLLTALSFF